jgi:hypothetical protein
VRFGLDLEGCGLRLAEQLSFVSGYRFSDTLGVQNQIPLRGMEIGIRLFPAAYSAVPQPDLICL